MSNACSALVNGMCMNGFMTTPWCDPVKPVLTCHACGRDYERQPTPVCMSERWQALHFPETGAPSWEQVERARKRAEGHNPEVSDGK